eukprot:21972-Eustigmatos_ZCMA.PRE.1
MEAVMVCLSTRRPFCRSLAVAWLCQKRTNDRQESSSAEEGPEGKLARVKHGDSRVTMVERVVMALHDEGTL